MSPHVAVPLASVDGCTCWVTSSTVLCVLLMCNCTALRGAPGWGRLPSLPHLPHMPKDNVKKVLRLPLGLRSAQGPQGAPVRAPAWKHNSADSHCLKAFSTEMAKWTRGKVGCLPCLFRLLQSEEGSHKSPDFQLLRAPELGSLAGAGVSPSRGGSPHSPSLQLGGICPLSHDMSGPCSQLSSKHYLGAQRIRLCLRGCQHWRLRKGRLMQERSAR